MFVPMFGQVSLSSNYCCSGPQREADLRPDAAEQEVAKQSWSKAPTGVGVFRLTGWRQSWSRMGHGERHTMTSGVLQRSQAEPRSSFQAQTDVVWSGQPQREGLRTGLWNVDRGGAEWSS